MKNLIYLTLISILFTSCASILNSKYQKVVINKEDESDQILVDGKEPKMKKGKYLVERDLMPKQITIKAEGFQDKNIVIMQAKRSPWFILSCFPFGALWGIPPFLDQGGKSWDYDRNAINYTKEKEGILEEKLPDSKNIKVNKVKVELESDSIKYRYFTSYKNYLKKKHSKVATTKDSEEGINIENTTFSYVLNDILKEKGYIDTTRKALKNSYLNNMLINATVRNYTIHYIRNALASTYKRTVNRDGTVSYSWNVQEGMVYVDLSINWEVLDYYGKTIYSHTTSTRSSEFVVNEEQSIDRAIEDVMESSFTKFVQSEEVNALLMDKSVIEQEEKMEELTIPKSDVFVTTLSEGIKSTVTITSEKSFGSGFVISKDGYIITNYHVVSDTSAFKAVFNDKSEYDIEVIRVSKIHDLALLKIEAKDLIPYKINTSKDIEIAAEIFAIGTPSAEDLSQTISRGIVSGIRNISDTKLIQTDASVNSGNSGGPLVNKQGEVVGVVASKLKGFGVEGVAFGIPAYEILAKLKLKVK